MSFLRRDVFEIAQGSSFLILDTCHAGAYLGVENVNALRRDRIAKDIIEEAYERHSTRYGGLFACAGDRSASENAGLHHGVLTYNVLRAMQGGAANESGDVTFEALVDYVRRQDIRPEPGSVTQGWGPATVLARLGAQPGRNQVIPNLSAVRP